MTKTKNITPASIEALDFIASRLLNFRRIQFEEFRELVAEKFGIPDAETLFYELIGKDGAYLCNGMLILANEQIVKQFCMLPSLDGEPSLLKSQAA
jgi:hypothetical protein